ncbi:transmembrane protein, putative (macronuclear) [Tetrahymena thermophila SB210]|uniref:Transmembrane protein, putative n=1 Tax=Tetrahymena thermophila (strain SB210) TaxID=312017 RepID=W7X8T6_TETTS|nr:transmembrane protein, putative [Tetrahymena thermophila SB210]EWS73777.1 transmembrane protein, putative [Tetrahymena thermophila SB210]|eukprot:XP_012653657.1 transmembrane protein, putative [Tetrahymena thermophila SB210]
MHHTKKKFPFQQQKIQGIQNSFFFLQLNLQLFYREKAIKLQIEISLRQKSNKQHNIYFQIFIIELFIIIGKFVKLLNSIDCFINYQTNINFKAFQNQLSSLTKQKLQKQRFINRRRYLQIIFLVQTSIYIIPLFTKCFEYFYNLNQQLPQLLYPHSLKYTKIRGAERKTKKYFFQQNSFLTNQCLSSTYDIQNKMKYLKDWIQIILLL